MDAGVACGFREIHRSPRSDPLHARDLGSKASPTPPARVGAHRPATIVPASVAPKPEGNHCGDSEPRHRLFVACTTAAQGGCNRLRSVQTTGAEEIRSKAGFGHWSLTELRLWPSWAMQQSLVRGEGLAGGLPDLVGSHRRMGLNEAVRPDDGHGGLRGGAQPEMQRQFVAGSQTGTALDFLHLHRYTFRCHRNTGPNRIAVQP